MDCNYLIVRKERIVPRPIYYAPLVVAIVVFVACGSASDNSEVDTSGPTATPAGTPTANEQAYLEDVSAAAALIDEQFAKFRTVFNGVYETRGALIFALQQAGVGTAFDSSLAAMEALEPPERFRNEHDLALDGLREFQQADKEIGQAIEGEDLIAFALANFKLGRLSSSIPLGHTEVFCLARFTNVPHLCERPDFSSSSGYGAELYAILSTIDSEIGPAWGVLPGLNDAEALEVIRTVAPGAVSALEQVVERLEALSPPENLQADHDQIFRYAGDLVEVMTEWRDAADLGDLAAAEAQQSSLWELFCSMAGELSPAITPLTVVHFGAPCNQDAAPGGPPSDSPPFEAPPS